jgi:hypothetical protein
MTDSAKKTKQSPTSWYHDDAPNGPTRLTNYALLRNMIGQTLTQERLNNWSLVAKIVSVVDIEGDTWTRMGQTGFELYPGSSSRTLSEIDSTLGPLTITGILGVPNREAEELMVVQRERAEFEIAQQAEGADPNLTFQSSMESEKFHWNHAWPIGSRVQVEYDTNIVWKHTVSAAYWYADQLVVDLCTGRKAVPVAGLAMRDGAEIEVEKWNENHGGLAYEIEYVGRHGEWIKTKSRTMAYVEGGRALIQTIEGVVISIGSIYKSETKADVAEKMTKLNEKIAHEMKHGRITVIPPFGYDGVTPRMGVKTVPTEADLRDSAE